MLSMISPPTEIYYNRGCNCLIHTADASRPQARVCTAMSEGGGGGPGVAAPSIPPAPDGPGAGGFAGTP